MVKLSKAAKARLKRKNIGEAKTISKAARLLADEEVISHGRWMAVERALNVRR